MDIYGALAVKIIEEQEKIIGPVAIEQAKHVQGVSVDWNKGKHEVKIDDNQKQVLEELVGKFRDLFGKVAIDVCKDAIKPIVNQTSKDQLPQILL